MTENATRGAGFPPASEAIVCKTLPGIAQGGTQPNRGTCRIYARMWNFPLSKTESQSYGGILW